MPTVPALMLQKKSTPTGDVRNRYFGVSCQILFSPPWLIRSGLLLRPKEGCEVLRWACLYVCLYLYLCALISQKYVQILLNFVYMLPAVMSRLFSDDSAICYVLPIPCITSFYIMVPMEQNQWQRYVSRGTTPALVELLFIRPQQLVAGKHNNNLLTRAETESSRCRLREARFHWLVMSTRQNYRCHRHRRRLNAMRRRAIGRTFRCAFNRFILASAPATIICVSQ